MSIATEMTNLAANRDAIKAAIEAKNPATAPTTALSSFPAAIASIPSGGGGGWVKPADWPDIEAILASDVTPQAAIDAGATKKWILLFRNGPLGGGASKITFAASVVYARVSDGNSVTDQMSSSTAGISPPVTDRSYYWIVAYSTGDAFTMPSPSWWNVSEIALCWVHAPDMTLSLTKPAQMFWRRSLRRVRIKALGGWTGALTNGYQVQCSALESFACDELQSGVTSLAQLFYSGLGASWRCRALRELDVSGWNVGSVTSLGYSFAMCCAVRELDVSEWNVEHVTNMDYTFSECYALTILPVSSWDTGSVTTMAGMFSQCSALEELDVSGWDTSSVTTMISMFSGCAGLRGLDLTKWDVGSVTSVTGVFQGCNSLHTLIGGKSVAADGSIDGSVSYWGKGFGVGFTLSEAAYLDHDSLLFLMYWIPDLSGQTAQTLTLGSMNLARLTTDEKAIATAKNWTLA